MPNIKNEYMELIESNNFFGIEDQDVKNEFILAINFVYCFSWMTIKNTKLLFYLEKYGNNFNLSFIYLREIY